MTKYIEKNSQQLFLMIVIVIIGAFLTIKSEYFLTPSNLINIADSCGYRLIMAVGMTGLLSVDIPL